MKDYSGMTGEQRRAERRRRLIGAGLELFGSQGYAATSIRAVLRESGLNERYFAESFASLEALLAAVHDDIHYEIVVAIANDFDADATAIGAVRNAVDTMARVLDADHRKARVKLIEVIGAGPVAQAARQAGLRVFTELLTLIFPAPAPGVRIDPKVLATGLVAAINELFIGWIDGQIALDREELVDHAALLIDATAHQFAVLSERSPATTPTVTSSDRWR